MNKYGGINDLPGFASRYEKRNNTLNHKIYVCWINMLHRCYSEDYHRTRPTYKNCKVCDEWMYLSNFVKDFKELPGYKEFKEVNGEGFCLDKDIIVPGNEIYSKDTCSLVSKSKNSSECIKRANFGNLDKEKRLEIAHKASLSRDYTKIYEKRRKTLGYICIVVIDNRVYTTINRSSMAVFLSYYFDNTDNEKVVRKWKQRLYRFISSNHYQYGIRYYKEVR